MALICVQYGRLPVVAELNAFEQIFNKLLRDSILCVNDDILNM